MDRCYKCGEDDPREFTKANRYLCKSCKRADGKLYTRRRRERVLAAYGGKCACCGEDRYEFLCIDHITGGGGKHRKELAKNGTHLYLWLENNGYPDGYRVLCHNCNMSIGFYGYCPHNMKS